MLPSRGPPRESALQLGRSLLLTKHLRLAPGKVALSVRLRELSRQEEELLGVMLLPDMHIVTEQTMIPSTHSLAVIYLFNLCDLILPLSEEF